MPPEFKIQRLDLSLKLYFSVEKYNFRGKYSLSLARSEAAFYSSLLNKVKNYSTVSFKLLLKGQHNFMYSTGRKKRQFLKLFSLNNMALVRHYEIATVIGLSAHVPGSMDVVEILNKKQDCEKLGKKKIE